MAIRKRITFRNGDVFVGELSPSGALYNGTYTFANGDVYTGEYRRDWPEGKGKIVFKNGDVYEGEVKRGKPHGNGTYTHYCGDVYVGSFKKGRYSGEGKYYSGGEELIYSGAWKRDDKHGFGTEYYGDGGRYEGYFKRGLRHGYGKLIYPENSNNVLKFVILLEQLLHCLCHLIVLLTDDMRVEDSRRRVERIHSRINTKLGILTAEHCSCIKEAERSGRSRVGKVIGRHLDSLY